jgi:hypothetical protein
MITSSVCQAHSPQALGFTFVYSEPCQDPQLAKLSGICRSTTPIPIMFYSRAASSRSTTPNTYVMRSRRCLICNPVLGNSQPISVSTEPNYRVPSWASEYTVAGTSFFCAVHTHAPHSGNSSSPRSTGSEVILRREGNGSGAPFLP